MKNLRIRRGPLLLVPFLLALLLAAAPQAVKIQDTLVDAQARTIAGSFGQAINGVSFQQDAIVTHNGYQYVTYYNDDCHVCVARRELAGDPWHILELTDYTTCTNDAHNVISLGICPNDGTIHLSFDHHGSTLHYRVSAAQAATNPAAAVWSEALFGPVLNHLEPGLTVSGLTYPRFWQSPDGNLQMSYRIGGSGNGDIVLADYNGLTGQWHHTRRVISRTGTFTDPYGTSTSRNAYLNRLDYGPNGTLHASWCWRETTGGANHDIVYALSGDAGYVWLNDRDAGGRITISARAEGGAPQTLLALRLGTDQDNVVGRATGDPASEELIRLDSDGVTIVPLGRYYGLMNQQTQAVDPQGRMHIVMWHCSDDSYAYAALQGYTATGTWGHALARRYHHYWRDAGGQWHHHEMPWVAGSRPKLFIRPNGDAFLIYQSVRDPLALGYGLYFIDGDLTICAATASSQWTDWQIIHVEPGPFLNEMLGDAHRFAQEEILSIFVQESPATASQATPLRILDFILE
ncbi:MAG: BNR repeat-containing protein [Sedimentisphaerales bacterium]|nr:BNR repeat-containing protein [Sedimentisphaerales bacterium]